MTILRPGRPTSRPRRLAGLAGKAAIAGMGALAGFAGLAGVPAATAQSPIGPGQHFAGLVNGREGHSVVYTVCGGPAGAGRSGTVAGGQTMAVARIRRGPGATGVFHQVYAWFVPATASASNPPPALTFTTYGTPQPIGSQFRVPCRGRGQVDFSSCPYLAPCAAGFVADLVDVRFENVAA